MKARRAACVVCVACWVGACADAPATEGAAQSSPPSSPSSAPSAPPTASGAPTLAIEPSATVSASAPPASASAELARPPARRGVWLWEFDKRGPSAARSAELLEAAGVQRVFIKGANGRASARWRENAKLEHLEAFSSRGMEVWIFGYVYAPDVPDQDGKTWGTVAEQVSALVEVSKHDLVKGVVVDAEEEFKDRPREAAELCKGLRRALPGKQIAYTTFGWLKPNRRFPYAAFDAHCGDAFLPQVYWAFGWPGGVRASLGRLEEEARAMGLRAPMWPIQSNEKDPAASDLQLFFDLAGPDASVFYMHKEGTSQTDRLLSLTFR